MNSKGVLAALQSGPPQGGLVKPANTPVTVIHPPGNWHCFLSTGKFQDLQPEVLPRLLFGKNIYNLAKWPWKDVSSCKPAASLASPLTSSGRNLCQAPSCNPNPTAWVLTMYLTAYRQNMDLLRIERSCLALDKILPAFSEGAKPPWTQGSLTPYPCHGPPSWCYDQLPDAEMEGITCST